MFGKLFNKKESTPQGKPFEIVWLEALEALFGRKVSDIREMQSEGHPKIQIFYFDDVPEVGMLTAVTCGLSNAQHPKWVNGKPELIVMMTGPDPSWGLAAGYFASTFFGEKRFSYGDMFKLDTPISDASEMNGYLVFAPAFLKKEQFKFTLPDRTIYLTGMYPVYEDEIAIYDRIGLKAFWHAEGFDIDNPSRGRIKVG